MKINVVNRRTYQNNGEFDIYIGRGSVLGNPFTSIPIDRTKAEFQCNSREESIEMFKEYIINKINNKDKQVCDELNFIYKIAKDRNVNLICYCKPKSCHGDVIKEIIESKLIN